MIKIMDNYLIDKVKTGKGLAGSRVALIFAPPEAFDYVVAHEVAHLEHLNHSKAFWDLCENLSDNFDEGKYWMDTHGSELMRYG